MGGATSAKHRPNWCMLAGLCSIPVEFRAEVNRQETRVMGAGGRFLKKELWECRVLSAEGAKIEAPKAPRWACGVGVA